ncbi:MAG: hypothetical protein U0787_24460 [Polyangia bacterium]
MQTGADGNRQASQGVSLLKTVTVAFLVLGTFSSLYHTYVQQLLFLHHDTGTVSRYAALGRFFGVAFLLLGLSQVYAVLQLARSQIGHSVKGLAGAAAGCLSVNLLFNLVGQVAPDLTLPWFTSTKFFVVLSLLDLAGVIMLLAAVLQVSRRAFDSLAVAFVVVVLTREAIGWGTGLLTSDRSMTTIWGGFAVRFVFAAAELGLRYAILQRASQDLASGAGSVASTEDQPDELLDKSQLRARGLLVGGLWLGGGVLITAIGYAAAAASPTGGRYVVAYGAIIYGVARIIRALNIR